MPIYLYHCNACDTTHEVLQKFSDTPLSTCPDCGGSLQKLFSPEIGLSFKGSGFYITDYVRNSNGKHHGASKNANDSEKSLTMETKNAASTSEKD